MITNCVRAPKHIPPQNFGYYIGNIVLIDVAIFFPSRRLCLHKKGFRRSTKLDSIGQYTNSHVHGQKLVVTYLKFWSFCRYVWPQFNLLEPSSHCSFTYLHCSTSCKALLVCIAVWGLFLRVCNIMKRLSLIVVDRFLPCSRLLSYEPVAL
jgi:hypothetical protein